MGIRELGPNGQSALESILSYLNLSAGGSDPQFYRHMNVGFTELAEDNIPPGSSTWSRLIDAALVRLAELEGHGPVFQEVAQARSVLHLLRDHLIPYYREFHRDLLAHQSDESLFRPFLLARFCEAILREGPPWEEITRITERATTRLNDYVGYRPVAVLSGRTLEPYPHERVCPIPIYLEGAGVATGNYTTVVERTIQMLQNAPPEILRAAFFQPDHLRELSLDPRACDFDHPVNKRPNHHFGQWDPHAINQKGFYDRFIVQEVTLNSLLSRIDTATGIARDELVTEASAVLAGTILMAAGISGSGPDSHDSHTTLGNLLPQIAAYRDAFYEHLLSWLEHENPTHAARLHAEAQQLRQPFGAARQHLNSQLTRLRASQLEHVRLAGVFARMGYPDAAQRRIDAVPVASARMLCQIDCNLTLAHRAIQAGDYRAAMDWLKSSRDTLDRAVACGAVVDPWNILGFDGNFSLFPAMENSIHDHRVDELIEIVDEFNDTFAALWSSAAAQDDPAMTHEVAAVFSEFTKWWHQFAVHEVTCVDSSNPIDVYRAAENVAEALHHWHQAGETAGAIAFWAPYVEEFDSPSAYTRVIELLLDRRDLIAARALLIHWLSQADDVPLEQGEDSFHRLALSWLIEILELPIQLTDDYLGHHSHVNLDQWKRVQKLFDYMEANAGEFWQVPTFRPNGSWQPADEADEFGESLDEDAAHGVDEDEEEQNLFDAAYENVVYRDSTDDGIEGSIFESGSEQAEELDATHDSIVARLSYLSSLARLRRVATISWMLSDARRESPHALDESLRSWKSHAVSTMASLEQLLVDVSRHRLARPSHDYLSRAEFDRDRMIKESLMEHIISASVDTALANHFVLSALGEPDETVPEDEAAAVAMLRAALEGRFDDVQDTWKDLRVALDSLPILYVPLVRGGNPKQIVAVRIRQQMLRVLLSWLPRMGMLAETRQLIEVVRSMERHVVVGPGAVTEFDDLFEIGFRALVDSMIRARNVDEQHDLAPAKEVVGSGPQLVSCLEAMTESMLVTWLAHSRTLRLSVLEKVKSRDAWETLVSFIKRYGSEIFTQQFLSLANIRSILYQGVENWLEELSESPPPGLELRLLDELDSHISRSDAARHLTLILEAVIENYAEYRDYNSTTTQSDRGELLFNFLDFLRLLSQYDRVVWNLKPVVIAHELLVRRGCNEAAHSWRRALAERISEEADRYVKQMIKLQQRYAMRLPTIADRIGERFLRPLIIDRMRSLVEPAMRDRKERAFAILEDETALLMKEPSGVGFDAPAWLVVLEEEVRRVRRGTYFPDDQELLETALPAVKMTIEEVQQHIDAWEHEEEP